MGADINGINTICSFTIYGPTLFIYSGGYYDSLLLGLSLAACLASALSIFTARSIELAAMHTKITKPKTFCNGVSGRVHVMTPKQRPIKLMVCIRCRRWCCRFLFLSTHCLYRCSNSLHLWNSRFFILFSHCLRQLRNYSQIQPLDSPVA